MIALNYFIENSANLLFPKPRFSCAHGSLGAVCHL